MEKIPRKGIFIVLSSPSGGGKTTIYKKVLERLANVTYSISYTTRLPRKSEINGRDYNFVSEERFLKMKKDNQFIESAVVHEAYYGTHRETLIKMLDEGLDVILDIDVQGALQLKEKFNQGIFIFIFPPSMKELELRLRGRKSDTDENIRHRLEKAKYEMSFFKEYDYLVINSNLIDAVEDVCVIIKAERKRIKYHQNEYLNRRFQLRQLQ